MTNRDNYQKAMGSLLYMLTVARWIAIIGTFALLLFLII